MFTQDKCLSGEGVSAGMYTPPPRDSQPADSTHPTVMHTCSMMHE